MTMHKPFVAVVTGASSGIGQAIAVELAQRSAHVLVHARSNVQGLTETIAKIHAAGTRHESGDHDSGNADADRVRSILCDITSFESSVAMVEQSFAWHGYVDAWINAAGADVLTGAAKEMSFSEKLQSLMATDMLGTFLLSRCVATRMTTSPPPEGRLPSIVHIGWDQSFEGMEGDSGQYFSAVKAAVAAFSKSLAKTVAPAVRVNCVAPGWIQTEWGKGSTDAWSQRAVGESMLNRWGTPSDVARVIASLSMGDCGFINGQTIAVNGGWKPMSLSARCGTSDDLHAK